MCIYVSNISVYVYNIYITCTCECAHMDAERNMYVSIFVLTSVRIGTQFFVLILMSVSMFIIKYVDMWVCSQYNYSYVMSPQ